MPESRRKSGRITKKSGPILSLHFSERTTCACPPNPGKQTKSTRRQARGRRFHPKHRLAERPPAGSRWVRQSAESPTTHGPSPPGRRDRQGDRGPARQAPSPPPLTARAGSRRRTDALPAVGTEWGGGRGYLPPDRLGGPVRPDGLRRAWGSGSPERRRHLSRARTL